MAKSILVVGLGQFGSALAIELTRQGHDVLGVDLDEARVRELSDVITKVVQGDATNAGLWRDLPVQDMDLGFVAFSEDSTASLAAVLLLRKAGIKRLVAKSGSELHTQLLHALGIARLFEPNMEAATKAVHIMDTRLEDYISLSAEFGVARITANHSFGGIKVGSFYQSYKTTVLALRKGERIVLEPPESEEIRVGDTLILAGKDDDLRAIPGISL